MNLTLSLCLNDNSYNDLNNSYVTLKINVKEMQGLRKNINELTEEIIYIHPQVFDINSKTK